MTICGENCEFSYYNDDYGKATCSCFIKINIPLMSEIKIDKDLLLSEFKNIKNIGNFDKLKCINLFFSSENFYKNSSNYLFIIMLILSLTTVFVFSLYSYLKIKNIIEEIYKSKISKNNNVIIKEKNKSKNKKINNIEGINNNDGSQMKIKENNFNVNTINNEDDIKNNIEEQKVKTDINKSIVFNMINYNNNINIKKTKKKKKKKKKKKNKKKLSELMENSEKKDNEIKGEIKNFDIHYYIDDELNDLEYEEAIQIDNRTFWQYYLSLLRTKHLIIFTFINNNDYNSKIIKIYIFFLNFAINYTISAMFYTDTMMHQIYIESGAFNFIYQLPEIIYSSIITAVLSFIIKTLGFCQNNILEIKKSKKEEALDTKVKKELIKIRVKIVLFFIITYILVFFFWVFLGCFCAVYKNTQIHLLKEVLSSFASSIITPFGVYLLPSFFRIPSLKKNKERGCLYKLSQILQII